MPDSPPDKIEDHYWKWMVLNEPSVVELTKEEYEIRRGFKSSGQSGEENKDVGQPVGTDTAQEDDAPISINNTKAQIVAEVKKRGIQIGAGELSRKSKQQLLELL